MHLSSYGTPKKSGGKIELRIFLYILNWKWVKNKILLYQVCIISLRLLQTVYDRDKFWHKKKPSFNKGTNEGYIQSHHQARPHVAKKLMTPKNNAEWQQPKKVVSS